MIGSFEDRFGIAADVQSWLYADAYLRHAPVRLNRLAPLPPPIQPFWYREPGVWLPLSLAIASDSATDLVRDYGSSAWTVSFTNTAGDTIFFMLWTDAAVAPAVTYGGVSVPLIDGHGIGRINYYGYLYGLSSASLPTGANNFVVARSTTLDYIANAVSYSGTDTTGAVEAFANTVSATDPLSLAVTVATTNAWLVGMFQGGQFYIPGTATTTRVDNTTSSLHWAAIDSNGGLATGSRALAGNNQGGGGSSGIIVASMKPAGGGGGTDLGSVLGGRLVGRGLVSGGRLLG